YHILDITPPSATVTVAPSQGTTTFEVSWYGTDTVGSISSYTVSVADTTPPQTYTTWICGTTATSALFTGTVGTTYYFYAMAEDRAGNKGQMSAPVSTTIILDANIDRVEIIPGSLTTLELGQTQVFEAKAKNNDGYEVPGTFTWQLAGNMGTIATMIGSSTIFRATGIGKGTLTAAANGTKTSVAIEVIAGDVHHLTIAAGIGTLTAGETRQLVATAYNQFNGTRTDAANFNWQIVKGIGTITTITGQAAAIKGLDTGTLAVTASYGTSIVATATFSVIAGTVSSVIITPAAQNVVAGGNQIFTANALNRFNWQMTGLSYTWVVDSYLGTISEMAADTGSITLAAATKTTNGQIRAMINGATGTANVKIIAGPIVKLAILGTPTVQIGMPLGLSMQTQDVFGNVNSGTTAVGISLAALSSAKSSFCNSAAGAAWTATSSVTIAANVSEKSFFFKHNGTDTTVTITATANNLAIATLSITIESLGSHTAGQIIADDGRTRLLIGTGTLVGTGYIEITSTVNTADQAAVNAANEADNVDKRINRVEGTLRHFNPQGVSATFTTAGTITIPYQVEGGYVSGTKIREDRLRIYRLTQVGDGWRWIMLDSQVDTVNKTVSAPVTHLSYFILMGPGFEANLNQVIVYPNPNLSDKHGYNIYFDRLTENSTIKIFNIAGELVHEITVQSSPQRWDTCNSDGERVASGIYIYLITDPADNKKTGKLAIIR
ncbi:MAG: T9SS type A sorting domain-containing protein, partial [bacterium]